MKPFIINDAQLDRLREAAQKLRREGRPDLATSIAVIVDAVEDFPAASAPPEESAS